MKQCYNCKQYKDPEELRLSLESKFQTGMTWDNYGEWQLDHRIPLDSAVNEEDLYKLNHYTNLQPLWKEDNLRKSNKMPKDNKWIV